MEDRNGTTSRMSINKLLEVEEHVWSPMYGLKGNIDATVQVSIRNKSEQKTLTVPFELKTGKNDTNESHRAQTALYSLLLSDRYGTSTTSGSVKRSTDRTCRHRCDIWDSLLYGSDQDFPCPSYPQ